MFEISNNWGAGFTGKIVINNTGSSTIDGWDIAWEFTGSTRITNSWNANVTGNNPYTASDMGWNASIAPGQSVSFGFQGSTAESNIAAPIISGAICD